MTCEAFRPVEACDSLALEDGINEGLWIAKALFFAVEALDEAHTSERKALAFIGSELIDEITAKRAALAAR